MSWGLDNEELAREVYFASVRLEHQEFSIEKCGLRVSVEYPFLGASPDGMVSCECCGIGCLEVKNSFKHRDATLEEALQDPDFCLLREEGLKLKTQHAYYSQVQCQLLVTQSEYCDFVMWLGSCEHAVVRIFSDLHFQRQCVLKARKFFQAVILPEMVAQYFTRQVQTGDKSKQVRRPLSVSPQKKVLKKKKK